MAPPVLYDFGTRLLEYFDYGTQPLIFEMTSLGSKGPGPPGPVTGGTWPSSADTGFFSSVLTAVYLVSLSPTEQGKRKRRGCL